MITVDELADAMKNSGYEVCMQELQDIIKTISPDSQAEGGKASIKYSEFIAATLDSKSYLTKEKLWSLFKYFDPSNQNFITLNDLKEIFARHGRAIPEEELKNMVKEVDPNSDGQISFEEFIGLMKGDIT